MFFLSFFPLLSLGICSDLADIFCGFARFYSRLLNFSFEISLSVVFKELVVSDFYIKSLLSFFFRQSPANNWIRNANPSAWFHWDASPSSTWTWLRPIAFIVCCFSLHQPKVNRPRFQSHSMVITGLNGAYRLIRLIAKTFLIVLIQFTVSSDAASRNSLSKRWLFRSQKC